MSIFIRAILAVAACWASGPALAQYYYPAPSYPSPYGYATPQYGQRCQSQAGVCMVGAPSPLGSPCYCMTPYGAAPGFIVR